MPFHYLTMNNYGKELTSIVDGARNALGTGSNTVPLMQVQYGVFDPGEWEQYACTALEAVKSMAALERALRIPDLQVLTFSGWLGHMIAYADERVSKLPLFHALKLYARMPVWRSPVTGDRPDSFGIMASGDPYRTGVMAWNQSRASTDGRPEPVRNPRLRPATPNCACFASTGSTAVRWRAAARR